MIQKDLLGLPLSAALEAAERGHLQIDCLYTEPPAQRGANSDTGPLEDRVIGYREHTFIVGRFKTGQPSDAASTPDASRKAKPRKD